MRKIFIIVRKEFVQISRNRTMLPIIFLMPLIQMIILVNAATLEMKRIRMIVTDYDQSQASRKLIEKFEASPFFQLEEVTHSSSYADDCLMKGQTDFILNIPIHFERDIYKNASLGRTVHEGNLQLLINAVNATAAGLTQAYAMQIISLYSQELLHSLQMDDQGFKIKSIRITPSFWYNPELNYKVFMVPGILVILVTIMGMFLSALNLVREKEIGTIEQINVSPVKKYQFIVGKLIPFWLIALFELAFGLLLGRLLFQVPIEGSLWVLFSFTGVYLISILGIGLFFSAIASTQQQVMFMSFFFMLTFILMSGVFTPVESMPEWAKAVNTINPMAYYMRVIRMVLLKGSGFADISKEFISMAVFGPVMIGLAVWRYRKTA